MQTVVSLCTIVLDDSVFRASIEVESTLGSVLLRQDKTPNKRPELLVWMRDSVDGACKGIEMRCAHASQQADKHAARHSSKDEGKMLFWILGLMYT